MQNQFTTTLPPARNPIRVFSKDDAGFERDFGDYPHIIPLESDSELLAHGVQHNDIHPDEVIMQFGSWVVTTYGMECCNMPYPIQKERLKECYWAAYVVKKRWVNKVDFIHCLEAARWYHSQRLPSEPELPTGIGIRFDVFKRDGYRCQICGRTPLKDGVKIEVDHKVPRAKGGSGDMDNLWTLCWDCNHGKSDRDL